MRSPVAVILRPKAEGSHERRGTRLPWDPSAAARPQDDSKGRWCALAVAALLLAIAAPARADDPGYAEARQRMHEGKALYDKGQYELARLKYSQACAVMRSFSCIRSLGMTEFKAGHFVEAYQHLGETLRDPTAANLPPDIRKSVETMKQGAYDATGHLEISAPAGATVLVDGTAAGTAPLAEALTVMPGRHALDAKSPDGTGQHADVDAVAAKCRMGDLRDSACQPTSHMAAAQEAARLSTAHERGRLDGRGLATPSG